jgi:molybdopterin molybdotransferase
MPPAFFDVRMRGFKDRTEVPVAWALLDARTSRLPAVRCPLADAFGRILASAVVADVDIPPFDRAAMDGYALRGEDTFSASAYSPIEIRVIGTATPGRAFPGRIHSFEAVRIMTGAPIPEGADAVLPAEFAHESDNLLRVHEPVTPGRHIGRRGEDIASGHVVLPADRRLRAQDLGILSALGVREVLVVQRPVVDIWATGDELLPTGSRPEGYRIVDSNTPMLTALVARDGGVVGSCALIPDDPERLRRALDQSQADVVLISGGSSVGQEDHTPRIVAERGELPVHGLALRPASPTGIGFVEGKIVFLLPGNPVSCLCAYDLLAGRTIRQLGGRSPELPYLRRRLPLAGKITSALGRLDYVRVRVTAQGVEPIAVSGASLLSTTTSADGFVLVDPDREGHAPGEEVDVWLYDAVLAV